MSWLHNKLTNYFQDRETRHIYVDEFLNEWLATQIKVLREQRKIKEPHHLDALAKLPPGTTDKLEDVTYNEWDLPTLRKLAVAFDVALDVSFATFGHRLVKMENFGQPILECVPFTEDPAFLDSAPQQVLIGQNIRPSLMVLQRELDQKQEERAVDFFRDISSQSRPTRSADSCAKKLVPA